MSAHNVPEQPNDPAALPLFSAGPAAPTARSLAGPTPSTAPAAPPAGPTPPPPAPHPPAPRQSEPAHVDPVEDQPVESTPADVDWTVVAQLQRRAVERFTQASGQAGRTPSRDLHENEIRTYAEQEIEDYSSREVLEGRDALPYDQRVALSQGVLDSIFGLGRIQQLLDQPLVENIDIEGYNTVWLQFADGRIERGPDVAESDDQLIEMIQQIARTMGPREKDFSQRTPKLRMALPDGSRLAAEAWICHRPSLSIRKHRHLDTDLDNMQALGAIDAGLNAFLAAAVRAGKSIVVSGHAGSGKTTLIRSILNALHPMVRLATMESMYELGLHHDTVRHPRIWAAEAVAPGEGDGDGGGMSLTDLVETSLQKNTDRLIIGEVVGREITAMLQAMQGGQGSVSTVHAKSAVDTISRMVTLITTHMTNMSDRDATRLVAQHVDLIVHIGVIDESELEGGRKHRFVDEVIALDVSNDLNPIEIEPLWAPGPDGRAVPTGKRPAWLTDLRRRGFDPQWLTEGYSTWDRPLDLIIPNDEEGAA